MGLQEIQNERFENSEYWPKQDSEVVLQRAQFLSMTVVDDLNLRSQGLWCPDLL